MLRLSLLVIGCLSIFLQGCSHSPVQTDSSIPLPREERRYKNVGKLFGEEGLKLSQAESETGIGVNSYLWKASLEVLSDFPIRSADPFGGVILTDWFDMKDKGHESFKLNVVILSRQLRSDGLKITVFRRTLDAVTKKWKETPAHQNLQRHFKEVILLRARNLKAKEQS